MFVADEVEEATEEDFDELLRVWEASVRATHHFLTEDDIQFFKPLVRNEALPAVVLRCVRGDDGLPVGFLGVSGTKIEMLFVRPDCRGRGVGRRLLEHALRRMGATELDVNEQNRQAVGFYTRMGLRVVGRSEVDGMGKPFPLLHMRFAG
ncbi:MAG TPA: acetyltransferase [Pyrinomonadaceae bacterium]|nr:acetyltransferase [Pyrinomonadaceae bacterium]